MIQFNFKNDFERFIDITIYIYGIHLIHKEEDKQMHMKLNLNEFEKYKTKTFEVFQKKIEEEKANLQSTFSGRRELMT